MILSWLCAVLVFRRYIYFKIVLELSYIHWEGAEVFYEISDILELLGLSEKRSPSQNIFVLMFWRNTIFSSRKCWYI